MFTFILKMTDACNLRCKYCCIGEKETNIITKENLNIILRCICEFSIDRNIKDISIIFHGGEPLLINSEIYDLVLEKIIEEYKTLNINFKLQTNGTLITDKFIKLFKKYNFSIGVSIDGSKKIHDNQRIKINGEGSFDDIVNNLYKLKQNSIPTAALMVQTAIVDINDYKFLDWFNENDIPIKINPLINCGEACKNDYMYLKKGQYSQFLIGIYKYSLKNNFKISIQPIEEIVYSLISDKNNCECTFSKKCCSNFLCLDFNGDVYPCGRFSDSKTMLLGNIFNKKLSDIYNSEIRIKLSDRKLNNLPESCNKCKFKKFCNGGCLAEAQIDGSAFDKTSLCYDYQEFFKYFYSEGVLSLEEYLKERRKALMDLKIRNLEVKNGV